MKPPLLLQPSLDTHFQGDKAIEDGNHALWFLHLPYPTCPGMEQAFKNTYAIKKMWCVCVYVCVCVCVCVYNRILLSHNKGWNWVIYSDVGKPRVCHTEWSKSERGKQTLYINAYIWNLEKWYQWTYFGGRNRDANTENELGGNRRKKRVEGTERVVLTHTHYHV